MTPAERLKEIRERVEAATAGPWELIGGGEYVTGVAILVAPDDGGVTGNDAEFIAHARTDLPRLLTVLEEVLEVHRPTDMFDEQVCAECLEYDPSCPAGSAPWPCFTVRTITRSLEGK